MATKKSTMKSSGKNSMKSETHTLKYNILENNEVKYHIIENIKLNINPEKILDYKLGENTHIIHIPSIFLNFIVECYKKIYGISSLDKTDKIAYYLTGIAGFNLKINNGILNNSSHYNIGINNNFTKPVNSLSPLGMGRNIKSSSLYEPLFQFDIFYFHHIPDEIKNLEIIIAKKNKTGNKLIKKWKYDEVYCKKLKSGSVVIIEKGTYYTIKFNNKLEGKYTIPVIWFNCYK
jgi:hypothetical protein